MRLAVLIVGIVCFLISVLVLVISFLLPIVNGPRTSWEEAMYGIIPGALCSALSLVLCVVGLVLVLTNRKPGRARDDRDD